MRGEKDREGDGTREIRREGKREMERDTLRESFQFFPPLEYLASRQALERDISRWDSGLCLGATLGTNAVFHWRTRGPVSFSACLEVLQISLDNLPIGAKLEREKFLFLSPDVAKSLVLFGVSF